MDESDPLPEMPFIKRFAVHLVLLFFFLAGFAAGLTARNGADLYQRALEARARGELNQAVSLLRQSIAQKHQLAEAHFELGAIFIELARWPEAELEFKEFLKLRPDSYEAHNNLATIYAELGLSEDLARELQAVVQLRPEFAQGHINIADYYLTRALRSLWRAYQTAAPVNRAGVESQLSKVLAAASANPEACFIQGNLARLKGDLDSARDLYLQAGRQDPVFQPARLLEDANRLKQQGDLAGAYDNLMALSVLGATSSDAELLTAEILVLEKKFDDSLRHLKNVSTSGTAGLRYNLAMSASLAGTGQAAAAVSFLEAALAERDSSNLRLQLAEAYKANGEFTKAAGEYEKLLATESDPSWVRREILNLTRDRLRAAETGNGGQAGKDSTASAEARFPDVLLHLSMNARCLVVEKETQTLLLYRNTPGGFQLEKTYACSTGANEGEKLAEGDERTPEGIYYFVRILPGSQLPETYGKMAITLDYPNAFDRLEGKGGNGIWVHATNEDFRPHLPNKTRGCVVVSNDDIQELARLIRLRETPLVIVSRIHSQTSPERSAALADLTAFLEEWRRSWESMRIDEYIAMYSPRFRGDNKNLEAWRDYKESIFSRAGWIRLSTELESIVRSDKYAVLTFWQEYRSERLTSKGKKRLFAMQENGAWKIVAEIFLGS